jgi:CheY-like chemotaxis protein
MGKKILVIEDNELNMKLVRSLLQLGDFEVAEAENAEKGIQLARDWQPDLLLMDIQLPGMDGLEATKKIKKDKSLNGIPIVALTSYAMQGDEEKALAAGCVGYITKPIDTKAFLKTIEKYLA